MLSSHVHPITSFISYFYQIEFDCAICFAEIQFFTQLSINSSNQHDNEDDWQFVNAAIFKLYSTPDFDLLKQSSQTIASCMLLPELMVIPVKQILSLIAMVPHELVGVEEARFFMVEKPGLDISNLGMPYEGFEDGDNDDNSNDDDDKNGDNHE